ncbi:hypothetical protein EVA_03202 [gut metagenome]|uniref:Uncharacterized protein n=1 Tax=gut metagenome TaxID=749906 RepID=J9GLC8_9ZZZZ
MDKIELKAFDRVLVRDDDHERWQADLYGQYTAYNMVSPHHVIGGGNFAQCIPYEGNEHLLGTTDSYVPERWEPKRGDKYYYIDWDPSDGFFTNYSVWVEDENYEDVNWESGNCFRTEEEAKQVMDEMNEALEGILSRVPGKLFDR